MSLLFLPQSHLEEFAPCLVLLTHLADLKPLAFVVFCDGVAHLASLRDLQTPFQSVRADFGLRIDLSVGRERMPAKFTGGSVIRDERQGGVNRGTILFRFSR